MNILWVGPMDAWARFTESALAAGHCVELHASAVGDASVERCDLVIIDTAHRDQAQAHHARRLARRLGRSLMQIDGSNDEATRRVLASIAEPAIIALCSRTERTRTSRAVG